MCHVLSCLQELGHSLQAATTYLSLFQTCVIFCHACRDWATGYRQLPHTCYYFRHVLFFVMLAGVGPQVTGSYHIPGIISDKCYFLSCLQGLSHKLQAATTYLSLFQTLSFFVMLAGAQRMCNRNEKI